MKQLHTLADRESPFFFKMNTDKRCCSQESQRQVKKDRCNKLSESFLIKKFAKSVLKKKGFAVQELIILDRPNNPEVAFG